MRRCFILPFFMLSTPALGQEEITVTGRGLAPATGEEAFDVFTIGRERLANSPSNRLEDVLRDVPGFQLFRRSDARSANPTSQGATLRALGGNASSRALLVLDGVPQTDPFGGWISWPAYDPRRLGQVRVIRGGGSGTNGPGALAGTIELESAAPDELRGVGAGIAYGSRDSIDAHAGIGLDVGSGFLTLSAAHARGDGFVPIVEEQRGPADRPAPYRQTSLALRAVAPLADDLELQANGLVFDDRRERGTAFSDIRTQGFDASLRLVGRRWSALTYVQSRDFYNSFASVDAQRRAATRTSEQYSVPSTGIGARMEARPRLGRAELRLGADWRQTEGTSREFFQYVAGMPTRQREAGGRTHTIGGFAEAGWRSGDLTITGGARVDHWRIGNGMLAERTLATSAPLATLRFSDRTGWEPTARAGAAYALTGDLTVRAAGYLGWRLPTLNELYRPFRVGADATAANAELAPERLQGIEAGLEYRPAAGARLAATLFSNRLESAIGNVTLGRGPGLFPGVGFVASEYRQRRNLDAILSRGVGIDGSLRLGRLTLSGGYGFADARVEASGAALPLNGLRPAQTPRHSLSAGLAWRQEGGSGASLGLRYVGDQFEDDLNRQRIPDALTLDAAAQLPIGRRLALELRAENLTDERVVAGISGAGIVERATARTLWLGITLRD